MILAAVARVRNEEDIVEAFVRHHAAMVDRLVLLDDASNDRTRTILQALKQQGLPVTLFASRSSTFVESTHNTFLARQAVELGADWVLCLDCDEFVDQRRIPGGLRNYLIALPQHVLHLHVGLVNYHGTELDNPDEVIVPRRLRHRDPAICALKIFVRFPLIRAGAMLEHGNHDIVVQGERLAHQRDDNLILAHYPNRSGWQMLAKAVNGRLKVLATGAAETDTAIHYTHLLSNFDTGPDCLLTPHFINAWHYLDGTIVDDPIEYLGGPLHDTAPIDAPIHAARSLLASAEALARRHGALLDRFAEVRNQTSAWDSDISQIF